MSPDGNFFFANTMANTGDLVFFMGGTPVSQAFYAPTTAPQFLAFTVQPDYALSQAQTIPFLPSFAGGTMPNAVVSPLYVVTAPGNQFGAFNATTNPNVISPRWLQASLAINGQGSTQDSVIAISTGVFTTANSGNVVGAGLYRGSLLTGSTGMTAPTRLNSGIATVADGNGDALFGGNTLDGFVLDQNQISNGNPVQQNAAVVPAGGATTSYGFNQPVLATALPAGIGTNRATQALTGYFGGIMYPSTTSPYVINGTTAVATDAANNRLLAVFGGVDPFTSKTSGISSAVLQFGGVTSTLDGSHSLFVDNSTFAATESGSVASQINGTNLPFESSGQPGTRLGMVTSSTVPGAANGLFQAAGATPCTCQFLQWGYWTGELDQVNSNGNLIRSDRANINTWIAGMPTVTLPTVGSGTYGGAAIGSVVNNGASYLAAGGFTNTYNFGTNTGVVTISNFDSHNFTGTVSGSAGIYTGAIAGGGDNRVGAVAGSFYGPGAAETGGAFAIHATSGPGYIASGIFAGKLTGPIR